MRPSRVDFVIDLAYGVLLFLAIVLILTVGTEVGVAFGLGALVSYVIHVAWKMARFDPDWMSREMAANIEQQVAEEVADSVEDQVAEEVSETVERAIEEEAVPGAVSSDPEERAARQREESESNPGGSE